MEYLFLIIALQILTFFISEPKSNVHLAIMIIAFIAIDILYLVFWFKKGKKG